MNDESAAGKKFLSAAQVGAWQGVEVLRGVKTVPKPCPFRVLFVPFSVHFAPFPIRLTLVVAPVRCGHESTEAAARVTFARDRNRAVPPYIPPRCADGSLRAQHIF